MEYCTLKGFLVVLVIQLCRGEGPSTSLHSSAAVTLQDGQALSLEPALPPAEVAPVVSPPSLKEVQQAVQEASEQVEGRGAEEVLKELLERVVEAAMGQVEGGSEAKGDAAAVQEAVEEDALGADTSESEAASEAEVLGQTVEDESVGIKGDDAGAEEKREGKEVAASEDVVEETYGAIEGGREAATESVETTADVDDGVQEAQGGEVIYEFPKPELSQDVEEGAVAFLENTEGHLAAEGGAEVGDDEQVAELEEKGPAESEVQGEGQAPAVVEVAAGGQSEQEPVEESAPGLEVAGVEQTGQDLGGELQTEAVLDELPEELAIPFDNFELETTESAEENAALNDDEDNVVGKPALEEEQVSLVDVESEGEVEAEATVVEEAAEKDSVTIEQAVVLENEGEQQAGEELQTALETSSSIEKDDQELLLISGPEPEDSAEVSVEQTPENPAPTPNPSLAEVEAGENALDGEDSHHGNEIITPTNDLLPRDPDVAQPTLGDPVNGDPPAEQPQATGEEPGEVNELVEDTPETSEANEASLEAWKIGAISAAVFLVLETVVIIIYILKCRNKSSAAARLRACEEGCVEPEAATGGDCSDDTLPAGNGDTQQISVLDASDVASTLAKTKEQQEDHAIALSALLPSSAEESANTGLGPDSSQDLRTSVL